MAKKSAEGMTLNEQMSEILRIAQKHGVEQNFFFITTFKRYQVQIRILGDLEKIINDQGLIVSKQYVKGRPNVYSHPAIKDYNRTTDSANKTVSILLKVIRDLRHEPDTDPTIDPLLSILQGDSLDGVDDDDIEDLEDFEDEADDDYESEADANDDQA